MRGPIAPLVFVVDDSIFEFKILAFLKSGLSNPRQGFAVGAIRLISTVNFHKFRILGNYLFCRDVGILSHFFEEASYQRPKNCADNNSNGEATYI